MNEMGDYHCWCPEGHHGKNCEIVPDPETGGRNYQGIALSLLRVIDVKIPLQPHKK